MELSPGGTQSGGAQSWWSLVLMELITGGAQSWWSSVLVELSPGGAQSWLVGFILAVACSIYPRLLLPSMLHACSQSALRHRAASCHFTTEASAASVVRRRLHGACAW